MASQNRFDAAELPRLIAKQRALMRQESYLKDCLALLREEEIKLQIEHLQLESMIAALEFDSSEENVSQFKPMDLDAVDQINAQSVDLSVGNSSNNMEGEFLADDDGNFEEEEEEEEAKEEDKGNHQNDAD